MARRGTEIIYIGGNHDDFLEGYFDQSIGNITFAEHYIYQGIQRHIFLHHGHAVDWAVRGNMRWLGILGDVGYSLLIRLNSVYNWVCRKFCHHPKKTLSRMVKERVKQSMSFVEDFEKLSVDYALALGDNIDTVI